jgi:hypothetical protein
VATIGLPHLWYPIWRGWERVKKALICRSYKWIACSHTMGRPFAGTLGSWLDRQAVNSFGGLDLGILLLLSISTSLQMWIHLCLIFKPHWRNQNSYLGKNDFLSLSTNLKKEYPIYRKARSTMSNIRLIAQARSPRRARFDRLEYVPSAYDQ